MERNFLLDGYLSDEEEHELVPAFNEEVVGEINRNITASVIEGILSENRITDAHILAAEIAARVKDIQEFADVMKILDMDDLLMDHSTGRHLVRVLIDYAIENNSFDAPAELPRIINNLVPYNLLSPSSIDLCFTKRNYLDLFDMIQNNPLSVLTLHKERMSFQGLLLRMAHLHVRSSLEHTFQNHNESAMDWDLAAKDETVFTEQLKPYYQARFVSAPYFGNLEYVEREIKVKILEAILQNAKLNLNGEVKQVHGDVDYAAIVAFLDNAARRHELAETMLNTESLQEARRLFCSKEDMAHLAWSMYDRYNPGLEWDSLLTLSEDQEQNKYRHQYRERAVYYYLAASDRDGECADNVDDRITDFIMMLGECRQANNDNLERAYDVASCPIGIKTRLPRSLAKHPRFKVSDKLATVLEYYVLAKVSSLLRTYLAIHNDAHERSKVMLGIECLTLENAYEVQKETPGALGAFTAVYNLSALKRARLAFMSIVYEQFSDYEQRLLDLYNHLREASVEYSLDGYSMQILLEQSILNVLTTRRYMSHLRAIYNERSVPETQELPFTVADLQLLKERYSKFAALSAEKKAMIIAREYLGSIIKSYEYEQFGRDLGEKDLAELQQLIIERFEQAWSNIAASLSGHVVNYKEILSRLATELHALEHRLVSAKLNYQLLIDAPEPLAKRRKMTAVRSSDSVDSQRSLVHSK